MLKQTQEKESWHRNLLNQEEVASRECISVQMEELNARLEVHSHHNRVMRSACGILENTHRNIIEMMYESRVLMIGIGILQCEELAWRIAGQQMELEEREELQRSLLVFKEFIELEDNDRRIVLDVWIVFLECKVRKLEQDYCEREWLEFESFSDQLGVQNQRLIGIQSMWEQYLDTHTEVMIMKNVRDETSERQRAVTFEFIQRQEIIRRENRESSHLQTFPLFDLLYSEIRFRQSREDLERKAFERIKIERWFFSECLYSVHIIFLEEIEAKHQIGCETIEDIQTIERNTIWVYFTTEYEYVLFPHRRKGLIPDQMLRRAPYERLLRELVNNESQARFLVTSEWDEYIESVVILTEFISMHVGVAQMESQCRNAVVYEQGSQRQIIAVQYDLAKGFLGLYRRETRARSDTQQSERIVRNEVVKQFTLQLTKIQNAAAAIQLNSDNNRLTKQTTLTKEISGLNTKEKQRKKELFSPRTLPPLASNNGANNSAVVTSESIQTLAVSSGGGGTAPEDSSTVYYNRGELFRFKWNSWKQSSKKSTPPFHM